MCEPMKPAPPVTRKLRMAILLMVVRLAIYRSRYRMVRFWQAHTSPKRKQGAMLCVPRLRFGLV